MTPPVAPRSDVSTSDLSRAARRPALAVTSMPATPAAVTVVIHGGDGDGTRPVRRWQPAVLRMAPLAAHLARSLPRLAVLRLINRRRGLGDEPLADIEWALRSVRRRFPETPIVLVGHSLGGSVALAAAAADNVQAVVALAPWLSGSETVEQLADRAVLVVHGDHDRVTSPRRSRYYVDRATQCGGTVSLAIVRNGDHAMLRRYQAFHQLCSGFIGVAVGDEKSRTGVEWVAERALRHPGAYPI